MIYNPQNRIGELLAYYKNGLPRGVSTGFKTLDPYYTVKPGEWTLVTGIPGHGKSEFLDAVFVNLARNHNYLFAIFSPENQPFELHISKLIEKYIGKPFDPGPTERITEEELEQATEWVGKHFMFIKPDDGAYSPIDILNEASKVHMYSRPFGVLIDPWNELDHRRPAGLSETEYISQTLSEIRGFSRDWNAHTWLVAHPAKLLKDKDGKYPVPTPYDVAGSAHWRNKADNCITVWRDVSEVNQIVEIHIQKVRFRQVGKPGLVDLRYDKVTGRYHDLGSVWIDNKTKAAHDYIDI